jgi:hypothetical protein
MYRSRNLLILTILLKGVLVYAQSIDNLKLIFQEENTAIYECAASPISQLASFRASGGEIDKHYIFDFKSGTTVPTYEQEESFFGDLSSRNTQNLVWSAVDGNTAIVKVVEEGRTSIAQVITSKPGKVDLRPLNLEWLNGQQLATTTILSWNKRGMVLLSAFRGEYPLGAEIPAEAYDLSSMLKTLSQKNYNPNPRVRELHATVFSKSEFVLSGVGATGMNDLYVTKRFGPYKQLTDTPRISESWPDVSHDDKYVIFSHPHAKSENIADLFIIPIDGGKPELLVQDIFIPVTSYSSCGIYQWTKDSKRVVFIKYDSDRKNPLAMVDITSRQIELISADIVFPSSFAISSDNKHILVVGAGSSESSEQTSYKAYVGDFHY